MNNKNRFLCPPPFVNGSTIEGVAHIVDLYAAKQSNTTKKLQGQNMLKIIIAFELHSKEMKFPKTYKRNLFVDFLNRNQFKERSTIDSNHKQRLCIVFLKYVSLLDLGQSAFLAT